MSDYQNGHIHQSLAEAAKIQASTLGAGLSGGMATSGYLQQAQQETVTSMLREILMRLDRIERKL